MNEMVIGLIAIICGLGFPIALIISVIPTIIAEQNCIHHVNNVTDYNNMEYCKYKIGQDSKILWGLIG